MDNLSRTGDFRFSIPVGLLDVSRLSVHLQFLVLLHLLSSSFSPAASPLQLLSPAALLMLLTSSRVPRILCRTRSLLEYLAPLRILLIHRLPRIPPTLRFPPLSQFFQLWPSYCIEMHQAHLQSVWLANSRCLSQSRSSFWTYQAAVSDDLVPEGFIMFTFLPSHDLPTISPGSDLI